MEIEQYLSCLHSICQNHKISILDYKKYDDFLKDTCIIDDPIERLYVIQDMCKKIKEKDSISTNNFGSIEFLLKAFALKRLKELQKSLNTQIQSIKF